MASLHKFPNAPARGIGAGTRSPPAPISFQPSADDPGPRFVRPIDNLHIARAMHDEPTRRAIEARLNGPARHIVIEPLRPTFGERLVHFFDRSGDSIVLGIICFALGGLVFAGLAWVVRLAVMS